MIDIQADILAQIPVLALFIKFMLATTVMLGGVWVLEKLGLLNKPDLAELAWKLAIAGSFIAMLPFGNLGNSITISNKHATELIHGLNETIPLPQNTHATTNKKPGTVGTKQETAPLSVDKKNLPSNNSTQSLSRPTLSPVKQKLSLTQNMENKTPEHDSSKDIKETYATSYFEIGIPALRKVDIAVLTWIMLASIALVGLVFSYKSAIQTLGSRKRVAAEDKTNKILREICEKAQIRHVPYLSKSDDIKSPICLPRREICLPNWAFENMPEQEFKSLLAHEIGHMLRRDPLMLIILQFLSRAFFFQPLFILARTRLTDIAELAADEWAAKHLSDNRAVANALYTCATKIHENRHTQWGLAMAGNKSILKRRIERLVYADSASFNSAGKTTKAIVAASIFALSLGLPAIEFAEAVSIEYANKKPEPAPAISLEADTIKPTVEADSIMPASPTPPKALAPAVAAIIEPNIHVEKAPVDTAKATKHKNSHTRTNASDGHKQTTSASWDDGATELKARIEGEFILSETEDTIIPAGREGSFKLSSDGHGGEHSIKFSVTDGKTTIKYRKDDETAEFDKTAQQWFSGALNSLIENTGIFADSRIRNILKNESADHALKVIRDLKSDYTKGLYLQHLVSQKPLSKKQTTNAAKIIADFDSSYDMRTAFTLLLEQGNNPELLPIIIKAAKSIDSDYDLRVLLTHAISQSPVNEKNTALLIDIGTNLDSDYELKLLYSALLMETDVSEKNLKKLLTSAVKNIDSDYELRELLDMAIIKHGNNTNALSMILDAATHIDSDYEKRLSLSSVVMHGTLNEKLWLKAIDVASTIDSDYEQKIILQHIRGVAPQSKPIQKKLTDAGLDPEASAIEYADIPPYRNIAKAAKGASKAALEAANIEVQIAQALAEVQDQLDTIDGAALSNALTEARQSLEQQRAELEQQKSSFENTMIAHAISEAVEIIGETQANVQQGLREAEIETLQHTLVNQLIQHDRETSDDMIELSETIAHAIEKEHTEEVLEELDETIADMQLSQNLSKTELLALKRLKHLREKIQLQSDSERSDPAN